MKNDSTCIVDFNGSVKFMGYSEKVAFWADYYPEKKVVTFGGDWRDVPNMHSDTEPTEEQVELWAKKYCGKEKGWENRRKKDLIFRKSLEDVDLYYKKHGYNKISVIFSIPNKPDLEISHFCGRRTLQEMRQSASKYLQEKLEKGSKIKKFKFETGIFDKNSKKS